MSAAQQAELVASAPLQGMNGAAAPLAFRQSSVPAILTGNSPVEMAMAVLKLGMTPADVREMLALQKEWEANEARKACFAALADFRGRPINIFKTKEVDFTSRRTGDRTHYKHAELADVTDAVDPPMAEFGLTYRWVERIEGNTVFCKCILSHRLGHEIFSGELHGPKDDSGSKNPNQQSASTITLLRRYTLLGVLGKSTKNEDDDGRGGAGNGEPPRGAAGNVPPWEDGAPPPPLPATPKTYPPADFERNLPTWSKYIADGKKTADQIIATVESKVPFTEEQKKRIRTAK